MCFFYSDSCGYAALCNFNCSFFFFFFLGLGGGGGLQFVGMFFMLLS